jgi:hypothetical protein
MARTKYLAVMKVSLIRCDRNGNPVQSIPDMAQELIANCQATADLYRRVGYVEPWVGYVAVGVISFFVLFVAVARESGFG